VHGFHDAAGGSSAVVRLDAADGPLERARGTLVLRLPAGSAPNHNAARVGDLLLVNDSNRNLLVAFDVASGRELYAVEVPGRPAFARGLAQVAPDRWLVGSQDPLAVYAVDLARREIVDSYRLGGVENETVFAISPLPDEFDDPRRPASDDPHAFWKQSAAGIGMTPIPTRGSS
jgi:hypothetical protein